MVEHLLRYVEQLGREIELAAGGSVRLRFGSSPLDYLEITTLPGVHDVLSIRNARGDLMVVPKATNSIEVYAMEVR